jgi:hypothetical protein
MTKTPTDPNNPKNPYELAMKTISDAIKCVVLWGPHAAKKVGLGWMVQLDEESTKPRVVLFYDRPRSKFKPPNHLHKIWKSDGSAAPLVIVSGTSGFGVDPDTEEPCAVYLPKERDLSGCLAELHGVVEPNERKRNVQEPCTWDLHEDSRASRELLVLPPLWRAGLTAEYANTRAIGYLQRFAPESILVHHPVAEQSSVLAIEPSSISRPVTLPKIPRSWLDSARPLSLFDGGGKDDEE